MPLVPRTGTANVPQPRPAISACCVWSLVTSLLFSIFLPYAFWNCLMIFANLFYFFSFLPLLLSTSFFLLHLHICPFLLSFSPLLSPSVPIRRNLIGNQSFWWKNGVGLSITVPWVLSAERGVQKRLYAGTVEGKVNAADSLSLALFPCVFIYSFLSETHALSHLSF